jgi:hypothetical protein
LSDTFGLTIPATTCFGSGAHMMSLSTLSNAERALRMSARFTAALALVFAN